MSGEIGKARLSHDDLDRLQTIAGTLLNRFRDESHERDLNYAKHLIDKGLKEGSGRADFVHLLSQALYLKWKFKGGFRNLRRAIAANKIFARKIPVTSEVHYWNRYQLGILLLDYSKRASLCDKIDTAINLLKSSKAGVPAYQVHNKLSEAYLARFRYNSDPDDLERAIVESQAAIDTRPENSPTFHGHLCQYSAVLLERYHRTGDLADLDKAISLARLAVQNCPSGHLTAAETLNQYAVLHLERHDSIGYDLKSFPGRDSVASAISLLRKAVAMTHSSAPDFPLYLTNLGQALRTMHYLSEVWTLVKGRDFTGHYLSRAIVTLRWAIRLLPEGALVSANYTLGSCLVVAASKSKSIATINEAISHLKLVTGTVNSFHGALPSFLCKLAEAYRVRLGIEERPSDLHRAAQCLERASRLGLHCSPETALKCAAFWMKWAAERKSWREACRAACYATVSRRRVATGQISYAAKMNWLRQVPQLAAHTAYCCAKAENSQTAAVLVESNRAWLVSESLQHRRLDTKALRELGREDLVMQYRKRLKRANQYADHTLNSPPPDTAEHGRWFSDARNAQVQLQDTIATIRMLPGFQRFGRHLRYSELAPAADTCPVIYVGCTDSGGVGLTIRAEQANPTITWLPELSSARLMDRFRFYHRSYQEWRHDRENPERATAWKNALSDVIDYLGDACMSPLMGTVKGHHEAVLIPTGLLSFLPLHAARIADDNSDTCDRKYALDSITLRYAPNAQFLLENEPIHQPKEPTSFLGVAVPTCAGHDSLPEAPWEVSWGAQLFPDSDTLSADNAERLPLKNRMLRELFHKHVLHLSTHGVCDFGDALESHIVLFGDDRLAMRDLLQQGLPNTRLVVISACEAGIPDDDALDEVIGLPTALLQAGVGAVIAPLWSISSKVTLLLMARFYDGWRCEGMSPSSAFCTAQRWLRCTSNREKKEYFLHKSAQAGSDGALHIVELLDDMVGFQCKVQNQPDEIVWWQRSFESPHIWAAFQYMGV